MSNENSPNSLPLDAMTFVRKYGGDLFYKDFAIKKSDEFADQLLLQIKQFIDSKDWKNLDRSIDILQSDNSEIQTKFFVKDADDAERSKTWAAQSPITAIADTVVAGLRWVQDHAKEELIVMGGPIAGQVVGIAAIGMALPAVAAIASITIPLAATAYLGFTKGKELVEKSEEISRWINNPKALVAVSKDPDLMSLTAKDHKVQWEYERSSEFKKLSEAERNERLKIKVQKLKTDGFELLKSTLDEFPYGAKIALHSRGIDELIDIAAKYEKGLKALPSDASDHTRRSLASDTVIMHDFAHRNYGALAATAVSYLADPIGEGAVGLAHGISDGIRSALDKLKGKRQGALPTEAQNISSSHGM